MSKFLNLDDPETDPKPQNSAKVSAKLGGGLKKKAKAPRAQADKAAVARAGQAHGFTRSTAPERTPEAPRRGRPPLNEAMTYWRIYIAPELRDDLNALRDTEGRRLNDLLRDMLDAYKAQKP